MGTVALARFTANVAAMLPVRTTCGSKPDEFGGERFEQLQATVRVAVDEIEVAGRDKTALPHAIEKVVARRGCDFANGAEEGGNDRSLGQRLRFSVPKLQAAAAPIAAMKVRRLIRSPRPTIMDGQHPAGATAVQAGIKAGAAVHLLAAWPCSSLESLRAVRGSGLGFYRLSSNLGPSQGSVIRLAAQPVGKPKWKTPPRMAAWRGSFEETLLMREAGATQPHQFKSEASRRFQLGGKLLANDASISAASASLLLPAAPSKGSPGLERECSIPRRQPPLLPNRRRKSSELESGGSSN